jgi:hypothetical protein
MRGCNIWRRGEGGEGGGGRRGGGGRCIHGQISRRVEVRMAASSALGRHTAGPVEQRAGLFVLDEACASSEHLLNIILGSGGGSHVEILGEV